MVNSRETWNKFINLLNAERSSSLAGKVVRFLDWALPLWYMLHPSDRPQCRMGSSIKPRKPQRLKLKLLALWCRLETSIMIPTHPHGTPTKNPKSKTLRHNGRPTGPATKTTTHGSFRKLGVPYFGFGVLIIRILLFRVLC